MAGFDPSCIDTQHMLESLEIDNISKATEHELRFSCPFPNHDGGDENPSCYMNIHTTAFFCHGCKEKGNAIAFTAHVLDVTPLEAIRLLRESYQPGAINPDARDMKKEILSLINQKPQYVKQPLIEESVLDEMLVSWEEVEAALGEGDSLVPPALSYFLERGFDAATLSNWQFGYDAFSDRPIFPVRSENGELIGFKGRAWRPNQQPKYFVLGDRDGKPEKYGFPCYLTSRVVFGAHRIDNAKSLVVCEGELNAIATTMKTGLPAVAINGSHFSDYHAQVIKEKTEEVILFLDCDKAGEQAVWGWEDSKGTHHPGIVDSLSPFIEVRVCPQHEGDAASMNADQIHNCLENSSHWLSSSLGFAKI